MVPFTVVPNASDTRESVVVGADAVGADVGADVVVDDAIVDVVVADAVVDVVAAAHHSYSGTCLTAAPGLEPPRTICPCTALITDYSLNCGGRYTGDVPGDSSTYEEYTDFRVPVSR